MPTKTLSEAMMSRNTDSLLCQSVSALATSPEIRPMPTTLVGESMPRSGEKTSSIFSGICASPLKVAVIMVPKPSAALPRPSTTPSRSRPSSGETPSCPTRSVRPGSSREGRSASTISGRNVRCRPSRSTTSSTGPAGIARICSTRRSQLRTGRPWKDTTRSPGWSPAALAGDSAPAGQSAAGVAGTHSAMVATVVVATL